MRHENIYHTCDRCGNKLKKRNFFSEMFPHRRISTLYQREVFEREEQHYKVNDKGDCEVEIYLASGVNETAIELCSKCRRAFKRFMLNR